MKRPWKVIAKDGLGHDCVIRSFSTEERARKFHRDFIAMRPGFPHYPEKWRIDTWGEVVS